MAKDLTQALHEATMQAQGQSSRKDQALPAAKPVSAIPTRAGVGKPGGSGSGSIAGPLTETSYAARQHWPERNVTDTAGILVLKLTPIKSVQLVDGNGSTLPVNYASPP